MLKLKKEKPLRKKENIHNKKTNRRKRKIIVLQPGQRITIVCKKEHDLEES